MPNVRSALTTFLLLLFAYVLGYGVLRSQDVLVHYQSPEFMWRKSSYIGADAGRFGDCVHVIETDPIGLVISDSWAAPLKDLIDEPAAMLFWPLCRCEEQLWARLDQP